MIKREYIKSYSHYLQRNMEILIFGDRGKPVIFFPTRTARFYDYENWKVIAAIGDRIDAGQLQIICIDSVDDASFYNKAIFPQERIQKHLLFEQYILQEIIPLIKSKNQSNQLVAAGCSLGAYHAANLVFRHPHLFTQLVALSGRYDLTIKLPYFNDLFDGYMDENIYLNMPTRYMAGLTDEHLLETIRKVHITFAVGRDDAFLANNQLMDHILSNKNIPHQFFVWEGEAHKPISWRRMAQLYF